METNQQIPFFSNWGGKKRGKKGSKIKKKNYPNYLFQVRIECALTKFTTSLDWLCPERNSSILDTHIHTYTQISAHLPTSIHNLILIYLGLFVCLFLSLQLHSEQ